MAVVFRWLLKPSLFLPRDIMGMRVPIIITLLA
jgi:hypothetical protein